MENLLLGASQSIAGFGSYINGIDLLLSIGYPMDIVDETRANLAANARRLREARGLSQQQIAKLAEIPRPTWANLESGSANPTLGVLTRAASALQVSIEELIGPARTAASLTRAEDVRERKRQGARLRPLLPETISGVDISRMELSAGGRLVGIPHTPGTREYLTCERGRIEVAVSGELWQLRQGDSLVFRGDQRHTYRNPDSKHISVSVTVVCFGS